jgi:cytochrome oxidase Cu insertion factor (SCO1/SenC/PrrC family)
MCTGFRRLQAGVLLMVLVLAVPLTASGGPDQKASGQPMLGERAPAFSLETVDGNSISLDALRGQFVVIHFAASW